MKRLTVVAVLILVAGFFYLLKDVGHIPLFSANLERLAETETEGYCAGVAFWSGGSEQVKKDAAAECRAELDDTGFDLVIVQQAFCEGIVDKGYAPGVSTCEGIVAANRYWPTYDGDITQSWSRKFPYPGDLIFQPSPNPDSRTGDRETDDREGNLRG